MSPHRTPRPPADDLVERLRRAVAAADAELVETLLTVLELTADEPMLRRLEAAMREQTPGHGSATGRGR